MRNFLYTSKAESSSKQKRNSNKFTLFWFASNDSLKLEHIKVIMLKRISCASLSSPFILFIDCADHKGSPLFLSIMKSFIKSSTIHTHVFCWERKTLRYLKALEHEDKSKLHIHDFLADSHGWINPENKEVGFLDALRKCLPMDGTEINIVVDSLSVPLFTLGFGQCLQELQEMVNGFVQDGPGVKQLLCLVHKDVLPCGTSSLAHLKHLANTSIELMSQVAYITHRKSGGHVKKQEERYQVLPSGSFITQTLTPSGCMARTQSLMKVETLPQNVASFRVSLSDKEKADRDKLVLPYMRSSNQSQEEEGGGGGKVFYEPDAVDDWDDEDPDDDLDI